jgi:hypothetical protein
MPLPPSLTLKGRAGDRFGYEKEKGPGDEAKIQKSRGMRSKP